MALHSLCVAQASSSRLTALLSALKVRGMSQPDSMMSASPLHRVAPQLILLCNAQEDKIELAKSIEEAAKKKGIKFIWAVDAVHTGRS